MRLIVDVRDLLLPRRGGARSAKSLDRSCHGILAGEDWVAMESPTAAGIVSRPTQASVSETLDRLLTVLDNKGIKVFARIDHSGEAARVELTLRDTKLVIFGNPVAGTPVMDAAPVAALDLPLKLLIWEREDGRVFVSYNDASYLAERHGLGPDQAAPLAAVDAIASAIVAPSPDV